MNVRVYLTLCGGDSKKEWRVLEGAKKSKTLTCVQAPVENIQYTNHGTLRLYTRLSFFFFLFFFFVSVLVSFLSCFFFFGCGDRGRSSGTTFEPCNLVLYLWGRISSVSVQYTTVHSTIGTKESTSIN